MAIARRTLHHAARDRDARPAPIPRRPLPRVALSTQLSPAAVERRWRLLSVSQESREALLDAPTLDALGQYRGSIENCIGALQVPVGLAGPLRIEGAHAQGDYYLPLATTEAAL